MMLDFPCLRLKLSFPLNHKIIIEFITEYNLDCLIIIEEQEPFLEIMIKDILFDEKFADIEVIGKKYLPKIGGLSTDIIIDHLALFDGPREGLYGFNEFKKISSAPSMELSNALNEIISDIPVREPTFCPGCSHRNVFYALKKAVTAYEDKTNISPIYGGDIGCYTMSMSDPYKTMDWLICMGAGAGIANGVGFYLNSEKQHLIAMMGDSTFFHSGIPPIINLAKNNTNALIIILDNFYSAMTGHQNTPSTPQNILDTDQNYTVHEINILKTIQSLGNFPIKRLDGYSIKKMEREFSSMFHEKGLKFIIVKAECALNKARRIKRLKNSKENQYSEIKLRISDHCTKCNECFEILGCTAIQSINDKYEIDQSRCMGEFCLSCIEVCPNHAIYKTEINAHKPSIAKLSSTQSNKKKNGGKNSE